MARTPRFYVGFGCTAIGAADNGHTHPVAEDGTIDCPDCAAMFHAPQIGTVEATAAIAAAAPADAPASAPALVASPLAPAPTSGA